METSEHFIQRPCDERGGSQQNPECKWSARWYPNHGKETETQMVWPHLKILWHGEDNSAKDSERSKEERKTEGRDGKITPRTGREWGLEIPWGQRKTWKDGKILLQRHLGAPMTSKVKEMTQKCLLQCSARQAGHIIFCRAFLSL